MARKRAKVDDNQAEIVSALRRLGYSVRSMATIGKGYPDLSFAKFGFNFLAEVKDGKKPPSARKLTADEEEFWRDWKRSIVLSNPCRTWSSSTASEHIVIRLPRDKSMKIVSCLRSLAGR